MDKVIIKSLLKQSNLYYHVTPQKNLDNILHSGIIPGRGEYSSNMLGGRLSQEGYIYLFDNFDDAARWASKMEFSLNEPISILEISAEITPESDVHFESQMGKGMGWKLKGHITPSAIMDVIPLTSELTRSIVQSLGKPWSVDKPKQESIVAVKTKKRIIQPFKFERENVVNQVQNIDNHDIEEYNDNVRMTDPKLMANKKQ